MSTFRHYTLPFPRPDATFPSTEQVLYGCDPKLQRQVLLEVPNNLYACMKCGSLSYTEARGDDGRYTGEPSVVYARIPLPEEVAVWLAAWPRVTPIYHEPLWWMHPGLYRSESFYLPATLRCKNPERLLAEEVRLRTDQQGLGRRATLIQCGVPKAPPPDDLPRPLSGFATIWHDLQLTPQSDVQQLIDRANHDSIIAADLLIQRRDTAELLAEAIRSGRPYATLAMLRVSAAPPPDLTDTVIEALDAIPMTPHPNIPDRLAQWHRMEVLLLLLAESQPRSARLSDALRALMRKVARHDSALARNTQLVLRTLEQTS
jgi:hypothetical protein